jgi:hypothetical protein
MTILNRRRPEAPKPEASLMALGDDLLVREGKAERIRSSLRTMGDALGGACAGMTAGTLLSLAGLAHAQPIAAALAGVAATLAVKFRQDQARKVAVAVLDIPGGRDLAAKLLGHLDKGQVATRKGAAWVVFDSPDKPPRVMSESAYLRHARDVPGILEIDATRESLFVTRLTYGQSDSVLSGLPAVEAFDHAGVRYGTEWHIAGEKADRESVMRARAMSEPEASYEEEAFQPRI